MEVYLSDENGEKGGTNDIQCGIEARVERHQPVLVENREENHEKALSGAIDKMQAVMIKIKSKMQEKQR